MWEKEAYYKEAYYLELFCWFWAKILNAILNPNKKNATWFHGLLTHPWGPIKSPPPPTPPVTQLWLLGIFLLFKCTSGMFWMSSNNAVKVFTVSVVYLITLAETSFSISIIPCTRGRCRCDGMKCVRTICHPSRAVQCQCRFDISISAGGLFTQSLSWHRTLARPHKHTHRARAHKETHVHTRTTQGDP